VFDRIFFDRDPPVDLIDSVNPMVLNDRLLVQQGVFLCGTDVKRPFHDMLDSIPGSAVGVRCIHIEPSARPEILLKLNRAGLNRSLLFPGLQGYSESLRTKIPVHLWLWNLRATGRRIGPETIGV
jgi:hypothetical protein